LRKQKQSKVINNIRAQSFSFRSFSPLSTIPMPITHMGCMLLRLTPRDARARTNRSDRPIQQIGSVSRPPTLSPHAFRLPMLKACRKPQLWTPCMHARVRPSHEATMACTCRPIWILFARSTRPVGELGGQGAIRRGEGGGKGRSIRKA
jgi:hypothetical protein